jgi:hypothetical protein
MYIDPNSGGMLFQVLAVLFAVFSGVIVLFSSKIRMAIARLSRSLREKTKGSGQEGHEEKELMP